MEDRHTSTVDGAAAFERWRAEEAGHPDDDQRLDDMKAAQVESGGAWPPLSRRSFRPQGRERVPATWFGPTPAEGYDEDEPF